MITSRQIIKSFDELAGKIPNNLLEDYMGLKADVDALINELENNVSPLFGEGAPENEVVSNLSKTYYDIAGATAIMYVNPDINKSTGWRAV